MAFSIKFAHRFLRGDGCIEYLGEIVLNDTTEDFITAIDPGSAWTRSSYERQWRDGLKRLIEGEDRSCLLTCLPEPGFWDVHFLRFWTMHRTGGKVLFRERWRNRLPRGFDPAQPYRIVRKLAKRSGPKPKGPEWSISVADIVDFHDRMTISDDAADLTIEKPHYFQPENLPREQLESELDSGDADRIHDAFLNAAYYDNAGWVQAKCLDALASPIAKVRAGALAALQILAAVRKDLEPSIVAPAIYPLTADPDSNVRQTAIDVLADIKAFFGQ
jgi:hypothetical protein